MTNSGNANRWALLIGVNKYSKLGSRYQLKGCVNDVELMAGILENNFNFPANQITLLRDENATRDGILQALDRLLENVMEDNIVLVHYSGHGSQVRDPEGDEPDGYDETIMPHDSGRHPHPNKDIRDDEIYNWLLRLTEKTSFVTLIFDCCHSGSITRDAFGELERWVEPDDRPLEELNLTPVTSEIARGASRDLGPSGWLPLGKRYVLIAGCRDEESSYEHSVKQGVHRISHGALTYFLSQELNQVSSGTTYRDVFERVSAQVTAAKPRQHPQMEGARDRELFGVREIEPMRFYPVSKRKENQLTLTGGAAHGLTIGSEWEIYPPGTKLVSDEARIGQVEITEVRAVTSDAQIKDEKEEEPIRESARAVESAHFYGEMILSVEIQAPEGYQTEVDDFISAIEESYLLKLVKDAQEAEVKAYLLAPREKVSEDDNVPQLGPLDEATWAVIEDGRLAMPPHPVTEVGVVTIIRNNLEKLIRYRQAIALRNPNPDGLLMDKVDFSILQQAQDETWKEINTDVSTDQILLKEGERIALRITNKHNKPIYVSVLDFGITGAISLLHPIEGANEQLRPGGTIEVGILEEDKIDLHMPDNFPYSPDPTDGVVNSGMETVKLFATTHEADFSKLIQEGLRAGDLTATKGTGTPLGQLLGMALTGEGTRDIRRNRVSPDEEWTTVERSFTLQRRII